MPVVRPGPIVSMVVLPRGGYACPMRILKHPIKKLTLLSAFGAGYTLGAKAGRERYEQIRRTAQQVAEDPRVQQATAKAQDLVSDAATKVKDDPRVGDVVSRAEEIVREATSSSSSSSTSSSSSDDSSSTTPTPAAAAAAAATTPGAPAFTDAEAPVNPLLADEHVGTDDEVVYSSGSDIEETAGELAADNDEENR